jgi:transcriptional regulator with XRE-family HTH domain
MIGNNIRELRNMHKKTQKEFAAIMGLSRGAINKYETNERTPDIDTLTKMAEYFGVSLDYLVGRKVSAKEKAAHEIVAMFDQKRISSSDIESNELKNMLVIVNFVLETYCRSNKK